MSLEIMTHNSTVILNV